MTKSQILTIIPLLMRKCCFSPISGSEAITRRNQIEHLRSVLKYIHENYDGDIGLESTAQAFFMNTTYSGSKAKRRYNLIKGPYASDLQLKSEVV